MSKGSEKHKTSTAAQMLSQYLRSTGRRLTPERTAVAEAAQKLRGHFSADDVRSRMAADGNAAAVATVYAGLTLLVECGALRTLTVEGSPTLYEVAPRAHHHLVCTGCRRIKDIADDELAAFVAARRYDGFAAETACLTVYGTCAACQRRRRRSSAASKHKHETDTPKI